MISLRLKGKWSFRQRQGFHSNSDDIIYPLLLLPQTLNGITLHSYLYYHLGESIRLQRGRKMQKGSQSLRFWRLMPKGEKILSPKQKDRTTNFKIFEMKIYLVFTNVIFQLISQMKFYLIFFIGIYVMTIYQLISLS